jgi:hypothetical protein
VLIANECQLRRRRPAWLPMSKNARRGSLVVCVCAWLELALLTYQLHAAADAMVNFLFLMAPLVPVAAWTTYDIHRAVLSGE